MNGTEFGAYLKQLRKRKGLTMMDVKDLCGISTPYMSQLETGYKGVLPSPEILRKLSAALGVTHIGMMIKAGHVTEDEVLTMRREHGIYD
ncbi:helix-turn-helix domain-containing protein [Paenibacillus lycopersici]|uniref:Helix-turn-helix domain-containing protein n=1 Tax=Paenibacillus lycopersici TaxID=2704462 RepID=A0A6C0G381_9BACL|nr:helix-turn-helix transcriptional regulator [Paenibacillus lycopersici]QHT61729.1 helix-turn-helix domain-containing protein [Paenibacillus lycopersici]